MLPIVGSITRPPDYVGGLFTCNTCHRIAQETKCSICGADMERCGEFGIWKPKDTNAEIAALKKRIEELEKK